jgi:hypothetical protein
MNTKFSNTTDFFAAIGSLAVAITIGFLSALYAVSLAWTVLVATISTLYVFHLIRWMTPTRAMTYAAIGAIVSAGILIFNVPHPGLDDIDLDGLTDFYDAKVSNNRGVIYPLYALCYDYKDELITVEREGDRSKYCACELVPVEGGKCEGWCQQIPRVDSCAVKKNASQQLEASAPN